MLLAVDGDILAYRHASMAEDKQSLQSSIDDKLIHISTYTGVPNMRIYLTGDGNFREKVAVTKPYKGNRKDEKPELLNEAKSYLVNKYRAIIVHGYEADDAIASDMVQNGAIHCGQDKDLHQIAGKHYDFVKEEWIVITPEQATLNFYRQILTGDPCDNIQGLPNVGDKTAEKMITDAETAPQDARQAYKDICAKKLPGVDVKVYWKEMVQLIELKKDLNLMGIMTNRIRGFLSI